MPIVGRRDFAELKNVVAKLRGEEVVAIVREPEPVIAEIDPSILQSALKTLTVQAVPAPGALALLAAAGASLGVGGGRRRRG